MTSLSELIITVVLGYAVLILILLGTSYVVPEISVISQNTTFVSSYQNVIASFANMGPTIQGLVNSLGSSQGIGDLVFVAFGSVITLIILVGQLLVSAILLIAGLLIFPFELIELSLDFAPQSLSSVTQIISSTLLVLKSTVILAFTLFMFFNLVEFIGGRKP